MSQRMMRLRALLHHEWRQLTTIRSSDRPWQMPFAAALAAGLPLLIGAARGDIDHGLTASLGGLVFLYIPQTPLRHRMVSLLACTGAMTLCYTLGMISHQLPASIAPVLTLTTILATLLCRLYQIEGPGGLFFIMAAAIGAYTPVNAADMPEKAGLILLGGLLACLIGFIYTRHILRRRTAKPLIARGPAKLENLIFDAVMIGLAVGLSLMLADRLQLKNPYWVPISCLTVIQGLSLRAIWEKQLHRLLGTLIGLLIAGILLSLPLDIWRVALMITALVFLIETAIVRHYGFAVMFITPVTILLADAPSLGMGNESALIITRLYDTLLGCLCGLAGGLCLHHRAFRKIAERNLRRLLPGAR